MEEFSKNPPRMTFRTTFANIERALFLCSNVPGVVVSNEEDAMAAIFHLLRVNGLSEVSTNNYAFELTTKCKVEEASCLVTVTARIGHFPSNAALGQDLANSFQTVVAKLQEFIDAPS